MGFIGLVTNYGSSFTLHHKGQKPCVRPIKLEAASQQKSCTLLKSRSLTYCLQAQTLTCVAATACRLSSYTGMQKWVGVSLGILCTVVVSTTCPSLCETAACTRCLRGETSELWDDGRVHECIPFLVAHRLSPCLRDELKALWSGSHTVWTHQCYDCTKENISWIEQVLIAVASYDLSPGWVLIEW